MVSKATISGLRLFEEDNAFRFMPTLIKPARVFSDTFLTTARQQGDAPADAVIDALVATEGRAGVGLFTRWLAQTDSAEGDSQPTVVQNFFFNQGQLPTWADVDQMRQGMAFFAQHQGSIGLLLGLYSLPYTYLGADGAQVLWLTERIKTDTARRLQETGEWVFGVMNPAEWKTGQAITRTLKIRLIHAAARWFARQSGRWQAEWGVPVNQEDMAATNLSFSYVVIRGLRQVGIATTEAEEEAFLHHFNVVCSVLGVTDALIPQNLREAFGLERAIVRRQFRPSAAGQGLANALLDAIAKQAETTLGYDAARSIAASQMRFFLGQSFADALAIPDVPVVRPVSSALAGLADRLPIFIR